MIEKLEKIRQRFAQLEKMLADPDVICDMPRWKKLAKERSEIEDLATSGERLEKLERELCDAKACFEGENDCEMKEMFESEIFRLKDDIAALEEEIKFLFLPKDECDDNDVIMEIRGGAGGDEAALFAGVLFNMYARFAERKRWKVEVASIAETDIGGLKEVVFSIRGKGAWSRLKFESGVHRVQRVPETESQGRVHTSTATVAVLPEVEDVDFEINDKDLKIDTYRSSGAGGQHINKTESAIRITHLPTGIVVACQDQRSQIKNKEKAFSILKSKLYTHYKELADKEYAQTRKNQVGTGERCERIRTYNYPQGRLTDHRINYTAYNLAQFLDGDIDGLCDALVVADRKAKLEAGEE